MQQKYIFHKESNGKNVYIICYNSPVQRNLSYEVKNYQQLADLEIILNFNALLLSRATSQF